MSHTGGKTGEAFPSSWCRSISTNLESGWQGALPAGAEAETISLAPGAPRAPIPECVLEGRGGQQLLIVDLLRDPVGPKLIQRILVAEIQTAAEGGIRERIPHRVALDPGHEAVLRQARQHSDLGRGARHLDRKAGGHQVVAKLCGVQRRLGQRFAGSEPCERNDECSY